MKIDTFNVFDLVKQYWQERQYRKLFFQSVQSRPVTNFEDKDAELARQLVGNAFNLSQDIVDRLVLTDELSSIYNASVGFFSDKCELEHLRIDLEELIGRQLDDEEAEHVTTLDHLARLLRERTRD